MKPSAEFLEVLNEVHKPSLRKYLNEIELNTHSFSAENNPKVTVQHQDKTNFSE